MSSGHGPWSPIGNAIIVSASTSIYAIDPPDGLADVRLWVANLNQSAIAFISFVSVSATAGEATQSIPIIPFDTEAFIVGPSTPAFLVSGATAAVVLAYFTTKS